MRCAWFGWLFILTALVLTTGCARYEYQLVEPAELARVIDRTPARIVIEPLEYEMMEFERRLGLRIINPTGDLITLQGERSYIVDPSGETRSMRSATIAPHSHISILLPPQPTVVRSGPRFGFGVGLGTGFRHGHTGYFGGVHSDPFGSPTYVYYAGEGGPYWTWKIGQVRMQLTFDRAGEQFEHHLIFERVRVR